MKSICPECKNIMDISKYPSVKEGMVIECNHCGITLLIKDTRDENLSTEIIDEGK